MGTHKKHRTPGVVEQVARVVSSPTGRDRGTKNFFILVGTIVVAGIAMVGFARAERQYEYPTLFDSWENAYAVFDCHSESWLEPFETVENPNGIRTRSDGLIYIEPTIESAAGDNAQLGLFLENVGVSINDSSLVLPDGTTLNEDGASCGGEEAVLQVLRWDAPLVDAAPPEIRTEALATTRFLANNQAFVIALAPLGSTIPMPPSVANLTPASDSAPA